MDHSAQSIEQFVQTCKSKQLPVAVIAPTQPFLGIQLAEALLAQNVAVCCFSIQAHQLADSAQHLLHHPYFYIYEQDSSKLAQDNLTVLFDQVAKLEPRYLLYDLDESLHNVPSLYNLATSVMKQSQDLLAFASKNHTIVGVLSQVELTPNHPLLYHKQQTSEHKQYSDNKLFAETLLLQAMQSNLIDGRIIRYGEVYGPRMDLTANADIAIMLAAISKHQKISLPGDGLSITRPVYISDFVYGAIKALFSPDTLGKVFTFVNPQEVTELQLAKVLQQQASAQGIFADIVFTQEHITPNISQRLAYTDVAEKELHWQPKVQIEEGIHHALRTILDPHKASAAPTAPPPEVPTPQPLITHLPPQTVSEAQKPAQQPIPAPQPPAVAKPVPPTPSTFPQPQPLPTAPVPPMSPVLAPTASTVYAPQSKGRQWPIQHKYIRLPNKIVSEKTSQIKKHASPVSIVIGCILLFLCVVGALFVPYALYRYLYQSVLDTTSIVGTMKDDQKQVSAVQTEIARAQKLAFFAQPVSLLLTHKATDPEAQLTLRILATTFAGQAAINRANSLSNTFFHTTGSLDNTAEAAVVQLRVASEQFSLADAYQKQVVPTSSTSKALAQLQTMRQAESDQVLQLKQTVYFVSTLFNTASPHNLVILPIDNTTLRPGGGVIDGIISIAVTPNHEPTVTLAPQNDPLLTTSIPASKTLQNTTHLTSVPFTQSLWEPSFDQAIAPFYGNLSAENNNNLTGVLGIDTAGLQEMLAVSGPITIQDPTNNSNQVTVTKDNFTDLLTKWYGANINSAQTIPPVIAQITKQIFSQALQSNVSFATFASTIKNAYQSQHLVFTSEDHALQNQITAMTPPLLRTPTTGDFFRIVDANMDSTKTSLALKETVHHDVVLSTTNAISQRLVITYTNESQSKAAPFGTYHGYVQIYLPLTSKISRFVVDNKRPATITQMTDTSAQSIGVPLSLDPGATSTVTIEFQDASPAPSVGTHISLPLAILKQTGTTAIPYELAVQLPSGAKLDTTSAPFANYADGYLLKSSIDQAKSITLSIAK